MRTPLRIFVLLLLPGMWFLLPESAQPAEVPPNIRTSDDLAVVVNGKNDISDLSSPELRRILLGEKRFWHNKAPVMLILREPGARERDEVLTVLLKMTNSEFGQYWRDKVFRGEAPASPLAVPSNGLVSQYVFDTPGGITFIAGKNLRPDLKVLKIDGRLPGDPQYPLK
ncbi:MAG TPA: hypothetical protein VIW67_20360 [Terriglobales bacterium]|jgi:ABC-type phosphate transport system substrate-binding protein